MYLGIDVGTTSVCAVLLNEKGESVFSETRKNDAHFPPQGAKRMQDPEKIFALVRELYEKAEAIRPVKSVGFSGQMHGVLYVDENGNALSPLYSWQDGRGNEKTETGETYAEKLSRLTGYPAATGFGATSLFYDAENGQIPPSAAKIVTIGDYCAMRLSGRKTPLLHRTNAASLGLFDVKKGAFDLAAIRSARLPETLFPAVTGKAEELGKTAKGAAVFTAIGDNQASVYGAENSDRALILNVGTGSQISAVVTEIPKAIPEGTELRPYLNGKYLLTGSALCGGRAYDLLRQFFLAVNPALTYDKMNEWAAEGKKAKDPPVFDTRFCGTRQDPTKRASVSGLSPDNFRPTELTYAALAGISGELKALYEKCLPFCEKREILVGSGNAIRLNPVLREIACEDFGLSLHVPRHTEEAAFGAALIAAEKAENRSMKHFIAYL